MDTPKIYVACLAAYNNGFLHGEWITIDSFDHVQDEIQTMLASSPIEGAEEWAIHCYEGFGEYRLSEYEDIDHVVELAGFIAEHGDLGASLLGDYSIEEAARLLEDNYQGAYDNEVDFAYYIFDECYSNAIPDNLICYFDYVAFTRDLFISDYFSVESGGKTHVFTNY